MAALCAHVYLLGTACVTQGRLPLTYGEPQLVVVSRLGAGLDQGGFDVISKDGSVYSCLHADFISSSSRIFIRNCFRFGVAAGFMCVYLSFQPRSARNALGRRGCCMNTYPRLQSTLTSTVSIIRRYRGRLFSKNTASISSKRNIPDMAGTVLDRSVDFDYLEIGAVG